MNNRRNSSFITTAKTQDHLEESVFFILAMLATQWMAALVDVLVHLFGPDRSISTTIELPFNSYRYSSSPDGDFY